MKLSKISLGFLIETAVSAYVATPTENFDIKPICCITFTESSFRRLESGVASYKIAAESACNWVTKEQYLIMQNNNLSSFTSDNIGIAVSYRGENIFYAISKVDFIVKKDAILDSVIDALKSLTKRKIK